MDILKTTLLYDFYGELLTEKQKEIYELFYQNDMSLSPGPHQQREVSTYPSG